MNMSDAEALKAANKVVAPHGLRAEFLGDSRTVGVGGDKRTYSRTIVLVGPFPGWEALASLSTKISNETGINRVTFELAVKNDGDSPQ